MYQARRTLWADTGADTGLLPQFFTFYLLPGLLPQFFTWWTDGSAGCQRVMCLQYSLVCCFVVLIIFQALVT